MSAVAGVIPCRWAISCVLCTVRLCFFPFFCCLRISLLLHPTRHISHQAAVTTVPGVKLVVGACITCVGAHTISGWACGVDDPARMANCLSLLLFPRPWPRPLSHGDVIPAFHVRGWYIALPPLRPPCEGPPPLLTPVSVPIPPTCKKI